MHWRLQITRCDLEPPGARTMLSTLRWPRWLTDDRADDLVEYALLAAFVGVAAAAALAGLDDVMNVVYASWDAATQAIWEPSSPQ